MSRVVAGPVLAIHPGALGDVLLSIPALRALRDTPADEWFGTPGLAMEKQLPHVRD